MPLCSPIIGLKEVFVTKPWRLFFGLLLLLFVGTLMPGDLKAEVESHFWHALSWSAMAHFVLFAAIASVPVYGSGQAGAWRAVLLAVLLAATTESLQSLVPGRHPMVRDVLIDLAGALMGLALRGLWVARTRQPQRA
jgi:VanZ family protein